MIAGYDHPEYGRQRPLSRGGINQRVGRVVRGFKRAVAEEVIPVEVHQALATVPASTT